MSTTIDERVVEMRFDNRQFEAGVKTSLSTLDKLKEGLDLDGAAKGLKGLGDAAKKCDLSTLSNSVETVRMKFSALEVMAVTALSNITNSVINTGKRMIESFTLEPVKQGFDEYELKMGSIQTIMMSTGASLEEVNKYLQELNTYSDKTIYSFQDMTSNIGKFTNAGVGLEDAVMAIQGVSNVAAVSGANANEASRAMYNFAQALSAGYVKLIDWKSIENANMATVEFKTQLLESAVACGTLTKTADGMYKTVKGNVIDATHISDVQSVQSEANQKRLDLEEEYADKVKSINAQLASDIQAENDKYENALKSREDSLYKSYGLFDAVKERDEVSGDTLMKNLEGQVKEFGEWQDILESLAGRGLDSDLIEELQDMGPDAIAQIKALNDMSDSELEKYADLWKVKHAMAREQAVGELEGLREETQQNIAKLREEADQELTEYRALWQEKMNQVTEDANAQLEQLRRSFEEKVGLIKNNTEDELQEMADTAQKVLTEAGWDETGKQIVKGLTEGVQSEKSSFVDEITQLALAGVQAAKSTLDIHSPSRVFREIGNYTGLGFVKGLQDYVDRSYAAGSEMAESAEGGLSGVLQTIADIVSGGFDMEPVIRPVLDLSAVSAGADALNNLFYSQRAVGLVGQAAIAFEAQRSGSSQTTISVDNDDVVAELRTLRGEMASMLERMEKLRVVLNTGALVGELAEPMDVALGQRSTQRGRGI